MRVLTAGGQPLLSGARRPCIDYVTPPDMIAQTGGSSQRNAAQHRVELTLCRRQVAHKSQPTSENNSGQCYLRDMHCLHPTISFSAPPLLDHCSVRSASPSTHLPLRLFPSYHAHHAFRRPTATHSYCSVCSVFGFISMMSFLGRVIRRDIASSNHALKMQHYRWKECYT